MQPVQSTPEHTIPAISHSPTLATQHHEATGPVDVPTVHEQDEQQEENWSFADLSRAETLWGPHGYHRYPAKFIPQLVRRIIDQYSQADDLVADPFLGSATTGVEALRAGRHFLGSDISPVALAISRAKCLPMEPTTLSAAWTRLLGGLNGVPHVGMRKLADAEKQIIKDTDIAHAGPSSDERFQYWFPQAHRTALDEIINAVVAVEDESLRTFFLCAFSNILRGCSIWLSGSTKAQKDLGKTLADPSEAFRAQIGDMLRRNRLYWDDLLQAGIDPSSIPARHALDIADARLLSWADSSVDLLVTSPPYSTCYEYAELHQLTRLWFERHGLINQQTEQHAYIGSKGVSVRNAAAPHTVQATGPVPPPAPTTGSALADAAIRRLEALKNDPAHTSKSISREVSALRYYFADMHQAIAECARVTAPDKYMVLVIGDSRKRGIDIPTSDALTEMAQAAGFRRERKIQRQIPVRILTTTRDQKTGRFSSTAASDSHAYPEEDVLVFKRNPAPPTTYTPLQRNGHERGRV
jgi:DNA modification methylase